MFAPFNSPNYKEGAPLFMVRPVQHNNKLALRLLIKLISVLCVLVYIVVNNNVSYLPEVFLSKKRCTILEN